MTQTAPTAQDDAQPPFRYTPRLAAEIETRWQNYWLEHGTFHAPNPVGDLAPRDGQSLPAQKMFIQDMFPYPSGVGLHVGHPLGYIATDTFARFQRMLGKNVLHTLGYDAFGLPAEQYAIQTGTHPRTTTEANIANMKRQLGRLGLGHDERRSVATTDRSFYTWTQWIFLQIFNAWYDPKEKKARRIAELLPLLQSGEIPTPPEYGAPFAELDAVDQEKVVDNFRLVYRSRSLVNWCPGLGTVLANEEVTTDGKSERGNFPVFRKQLSQWMMRITAYADRLVDDLDLLDWPEKVKSMQRNWIGRSRGAEVDFDAEGHRITVFTTRPDTLFGATYVVLAPEHDLVDTLVALAGEEAYAGVDKRWTYGEATPAAAVEAYRRTISAKSDLERQENKEKTGVFLGVYAKNPVSGARVPVFIGDYVLTGYGTGAIMAVPAHDQRDYEFATAFGIDIVEVLSGGTIEKEAFVGDGPHVNSANDDGLDINGLNKQDAIAATIAWLSDHGVGTERVQYKLRDWLFARQRYWGEPFPIVYDDNDIPHALPEEMLPVELPDVKDYQPVTFDPNDRDTNPQAPLNKAIDWVNVELDLGDGLKHYTRDTNVMPQWAGSSWYQLRYIDPTNTEKFCDPENERYWTGPREDVPGGGVDLYVGGVEHAVLHLLYARFWHKVLFDLGYVSSCEPYHRLFNQGYIQAFAYTDVRGVYVPAEEVVERDGEFYYHGEKVFQEYGKMGKSLKNSVSPDEMCDTFGADTLRVYEMSMGPLDASRPWSTKDVVGSQRFLQRLWRLVISESEGTLVVDDSEAGRDQASLPEDVVKALHRTIAGIRDDYENLRINTVVAKLIEYTNLLTKTYSAEGLKTPLAAVEPVIVMVAPIAPHIAEELWSRLGHKETITYVPFPEYDEKYLVDSEIEIPVQVGGKVRSHIMVPVDASTDELIARAQADPKIAALIDGKTVVKKIVVPGRLINLVVK